VERRDPRGINGSRKRRIADGSGTRPQDVNRVLKQFSEAQKIMKAVAVGKSPIPGLAAPAMARRRKR
jgi:signal recognition particle subunit SRP54